ncbi:MAG: penicillin-binding protein activator LpoB [Spongiibacter marinus]|uniref:penicillin-binding protein activator LpoB n=1 Tax=Spongiibacter marinus TaxID=354246 RepID=UPI003C5CB380
MMTFRSLTILILSALLCACGSSNVKRMENGSQPALTDRWNATDSQLVAEALISDMLSFPWAKSRDDGSLPVIAIQHISNRSHEQIAVETFINSIKRELLRSGKAEFVVTGAERERVRDEKLDQEMFASMESAIELGEETAAGYALSGVITSLVDQLEGQRTTTYQVDLKLIDLKSNREVWNGQKQIHKYSKRARFGL